MSDPKRIGRYDVDRLLGQGGMGRVWLARDSVLGRNVAIKVLRDDLALPPAVHDELVERMRHEARAAAAVSHPNIVTLHDMGEDPKLGLFLVFEYVTPQGEAAPVTLRDAASAAGGAGPVTLRDRLKRGPLAFTDVAKLAREVGSALSFAHEAGVIHRDVKPENVLFSRTGFKIADFGIARIPDSTITRANTVLGTPAYTAPEALSKGDFGPASDQFSLAATIYEAATGARAFSGDDAIVTAGKVSSEPPPPLQDSIGADPSVKALDAVLQRGLAKAPESRFASCAALGAEVARAIDAETEGARPPRRGIGGLLTPVPDILELERTPLSSRMTPSERPPVDVAVLTPSPMSRDSLFQRKRTQRFQNIAVAVALIVIVALVLMGRRTPRAADDGSTDAGAAPTPGITSPPPKPHAKPKPVVPAAATTSARPSAAPTADDASTPED